MALWVTMRVIGLLLRDNRQWILDGPAAPDEWGFPDGASLTIDQVEPGRVRTE